jgi:Caspase domain
MFKRRRRWVSWVVLLLAEALSSLPAVCAQAATPQRGVSPVGSQPGTPPQENGAYYALIIGIDNYPNLPKLVTAVADAQALKEILQTRYGFEVILLTDASRNQIMSALSDYRRKLHDDDNLLIYYAGHGMYDRDANKGYWLPLDANRDDFSNWIIADEITTGARVIPARHVLVVSDSCYAGTLTRSVGMVDTPLDPSRYLQKMLHGKSRNLMASGGNEPVLDGGAATGHSIFANALLQGLNKMEQSSFSAQDLFNTFIQRYVVGGSDQVPQICTHPQFRRCRGRLRVCSVGLRKIRSAPPDQVQAWQCRFERRLGES